MTSTCAKVSPNVSRKLAEVDARTLAAKLGDLEADALLESLADKLKVAKPRHGAMQWVI